MNEHDIRRLTDAITEAVLREISSNGLNAEIERPVVGASIARPPQNIDDAPEITRMKQSTPARIAVGRAGARLRTDTYLAFRADHAAARDAVLLDVAPDFLERLGLETVTTRCADKNEFLTRPDLGRVFPRESLEKIRALNPEPADVLVYLADGLSSKAVEANGETILPIMLEGLRGAGLKVGQPFFVKYGRVGTMEEIAQAVGAKVVCVLLGERPGLGSAESMSAYLAYNARPGIPESERTVVSNIYAGGINAAEAGAYLTEVLERVFREKKSGV